MNAAVLCSILGVVQVCFRGPAPLGDLGTGIIPLYKPNVLRHSCVSSAASEHV